MKISKKNMLEEIKKISIIIPVFNEQENIKELFEKILRVIFEINLNCEIIFVNDGSTDSSLQVIKKLFPVKVINFRKNFGQTAAMDAGIKEAKGKYIITMDGDGQNDPEDIPLLINKLEKENLDVVSGWRKNRKDSFSKKISSKFAAGMRKFLINDGIHDSGCTLKIYKKECFKNIDLTGEMHRFIPAILKIKGFKIGEIEVKHHFRKFGKTKYNWKRGIKGNLDMFSLWFWKKFSARPLHLFGSFGLLLIFVSFASGFFAIYKKLFENFDLSNTALTSLSLFSFLMGIQFFVFGLLADLLSKIYFSTTKDKIYDIKEIITMNKKNEK